MRRSSQFLVGGLVLIALGLAFYLALVLLQAAGDLGSLAFGLASGTPGLFVLVAALFFAHAWSMRKSERMLSSGDPLPPPPIR
jgi:lipopolysaccharide export LptBFGC system permease protein LptF